MVVPKAIKIGLLLLLFLVGGSIGIYLAAPYFIDIHHKSVGNHLIRKIEKFRLENGRLPSNLSEIGEKEADNGPIYYQRNSERDYVIWYGKRLGESAYYNSQKGCWDVDG